LKNLILISHYLSGGANILGLLLPYSQSASLVDFVVILYVIIATMFLYYITAVLLFHYSRCFIGG
jgi:hypothetical protein